MDVGDGTDPVGERLRLCEATPTPPASGCSFAHPDLGRWTLPSNKGSGCSGRLRLVEHLGRWSRCRVPSAPQRQRPRGPGKLTRSFELSGSVPALSAGTSPPPAADLQWGAQRAHLGVGLPLSEVPACVFLTTDIFFGVKERSSGLQGGAEERSL